MDEAQLRQFSEARVGTLLCDKWRLERLLGVGGTASVYSASHRNGKRVAVKVLHPELSAQKTFRDRFLREGYVGNRIEHEGAVTVYDDDQTEDHCALLVMDLLEGENLEARRDRKGGKLEPLEVLSLMDDVLDTLRAAHAKGVVHRDIKPENLFVTTENKVKLLDFGIARIDVAESPGKTLAGVAMGTPAFMPPEQASAHWEDVDAKSDVWAIGASMFTLLTGRYVHEGQTVNESLAMAVTKHAPAIESIEPTLPGSIVIIVNKALQRDKGKRWATAEAMQEAVRLAYRDLQDAPEGERYSLSAGKVASHSAPPADFDNRVSVIGATTGEPVSSDLMVPFRDNNRRKMILGVGAAALVGGLIAIFASGSGDTQAQGTAATPSPEKVNEPDPPALATATLTTVTPVSNPEPDPIEPAPSATVQPAADGPKSAAKSQESKAETTKPVAKPQKRWKPKPTPKKPEPFDPFKSRD